MLPLAITSTKGWIRRLGGRRWRALHRLVYVSGIAGTIHYFWNYKVAEPGPLLYILILLVLLGYRLLGRLRGPAPPAPAS
jgi:sulfoxide reductase heme-binding subunit YedZ